MATSAIQISAASRLFSSAVFKEMSKKGKSGLFSRLLQQSGIAEALSEAAQVSDAFEAAFSTLRAVGHRDEYIYKAALTHKVLLGTHSLKTASMLTEFRAGPCKADLVIFNGTATVYEIKSERDSLARLERQLEAYRKVFACAYVIASEDHVAGVEAIAPYDVGILCLTKRQRITTVRKAVDAPERICPVSLFESLRTAEAVQILRNLGEPVPQAPNTRLHAALREQFKGLSPALVHAEMVKVLKRSRNLLPLSDLVNELPASLHAAALTISVRRSDHGKLVAAVNTPLRDALNWA